MREAALEREHLAGQGGTQKLYRFKNNYGASVVIFPGSYGYARGLLELAVIHFNNADNLDSFDIIYDTPITDDVIGHLSEEEVGKLLDKIEALPFRED